MSNTQYCQSQNLIVFNINTLGNGFLSLYRTIKRKKYLICFIIFSEYILDNSVAMVPVKLANGNSNDGDHRYDCPFYKKNKLYSALECQ